MQAERACKLQARFIVFVIGILRLQHFAVIEQQIELLTITPTVDVKKTIPEVFLMKRSLAASQTCIKHQFYDYITNKKCLQFTYNLIEFL